MSEQLELPNEDRQLHDPGGKVRLRLPPGISSTAQFSPCQRYRYVLERIWSQETTTKAIWIMCNPSTAQQAIDDPTVAKCRRFSQQWGFGRMAVLNVMAYRATHPSDLLKIDDPVGPENHATIRDALQFNPGDKLICAWGRPPHRRLQPHYEAVHALLRSLPITPHALRVNLDGSPAHPLYLPYWSTPAPWEMPH